MGQIIEVKRTKLNKTIIFDLNRSVSGQEGMTFHNISEASLIPDVSGQLALKLFQETSDIDTIFIQSKQHASGHIIGFHNCNVHIMVYSSLDK